MKTKTRSSCRVCNSRSLSPILSLGKLHVSDFITEKKHLKPEPLELVLCNKEEGGCGLLQLKHTVSHEKMYRNYWYRSGMNQTMTSELHSIAKKVQSLVSLSPGDFVMDIGANDGTLLRGYTIPGLHTVGFEPARNLVQFAKKDTTKIINDFFNARAWNKEVHGSKAKAITAIAMFYDLEDPNSFVSDITKCLDDEGVFIIQMSYLPLMLSQNAFDNICHEHLEYYSLDSLEFLLARHGLEIFDVELNGINGGSFRIYTKFKNSKAIRVPVEAPMRVQSLRHFEKKLGLDQINSYHKFQKRVLDIKETVSTFIRDEVQNGKKVHVYGASTKGNTLLQFFDLDNTVITAAAERNPDKWGTKTIGTNIPIVSEERARKDAPDYFLVLPWHFLDEFVDREREYLARGGKFIVPLPEPKIIDLAGSTDLVK